VMRRYTAALAVLAIAFSVSAAAQQKPSTAAEKAAAEQRAGAARHSLARLVRARSESVAKERASTALDDGRSSAVDGSVADSHRPVRPRAQRFPAVPCRVGDRAALRPAGSSCRHTAPDAPRAARVASRPPAKGLRGDAAVSFCDADRSPSSGSRPLCLCPPRCRGARGAVCRSRAGRRAAHAGCRSRRSGLAGGGQRVGRIDGARAPGLLASRRDEQPARI